MLSDAQQGLMEAIDNAVEYFMDKGLRPTDVLAVLSNNRQAWKDRYLSDAASREVDRWLADIFGDGRGTE